MKNLGLFNTSKINSLLKLHSRSLYNSLPKRNFAAEEIKISKKQQNSFYPVKGIPTFHNGLFTVFEYKPNKIEKDDKGTFQKLPQVPYEIKEHAFKGFFYTFFLVWSGRVWANFSDYFLYSQGGAFFPYIPLGVFLYQYSSALWKMSNAVTAIRLKEDGKSVILEFKNVRKPLEVEIWRLTKKREETFLYECYSEPFLYPITIDYTDVYGEYSLRSTQKVYLYGDSNSCIKHGEILRAILNSQPIKLN